MNIFYLIFALLLPMQINAMFESTAEDIIKEIFEAKKKELELTGGISFDGDDDDDQDWLEELDYELLLPQIQGKGLRIVEYDFYDDESGWDNFISALKKNPNIATLGLSDNGLTSKQFSALFDALKKNDTIQALFISENVMGDEGAKNLARFITAHPTLKYVGFPYCGMSREGFVSVIKALSTLPYIIEVDISYALAKSNSNENIGHALAHFITSNKHLHVMRATGLAIGSKGFERIVHALTSISKEKQYELHTLYIDKNDISLQEEKVRNLFKNMLAHNDTIIRLNIAYNSLGDSGAAAVADALKSNRTLEKISLESSGITNQGAEKLLQRVSENNSLYEMRLDDNEIDNQDLLNKINQKLNLNKPLHLKLQPNGDTHWD